MQPANTMIVCRSLLQGWIASEARPFTIGSLATIASSGYHKGYFPSDFQMVPDGVILSLKDRQFDKYSPSTATEKGYGGLARGGANVLGIVSVSLKKRCFQDCRTQRSLMR